MLDVETMEKQVEGREPKGKERRFKGRKGKQINEDLERPTKVC